jgi:hypothetical protein
MLYDPPALSVTLNYVGDKPDEGVLARFPELKYTTEKDNYGAVWIIDDKAITELYRDAIKGSLDRARDYDPANNTHVYNIPSGLDSETGGILARTIGPERAPIFPADLAVSVLKEVIPDAKIFIGGWGISTSVRSFDDFEQRVLKPLEPLGLDASKDLMSGVSYGAFNWPQYATIFDYFRGIPFEFGYIDSFNNHDYYHADVPHEDLIAAFKDLLNNPRSNCTAVGYYPERVDCDPMFSYLFWRLAWDPFDIEDFDTFLRRDWLPRRYAPKSQGAMYRSTKALAEALSKGELASDPYITGYLPVYRYSHYMSYNMVSSYPRRYVSWKNVRLLERALEEALTVTDHESKNVLYRRYLINVFHNYASEVFKLAMIRSYSAYFQLTKLFGDSSPDLKRGASLRAQFEENAESMDHALLQIEKVWATDGVFSTNVLFDVSNAHAGGKPEERPAIVGLEGAHASVWGNTFMYPELRDHVARVTPALSVGSVECLENYYRPMVRGFLDDLRMRLDRKDPVTVAAPVNWWSTYNWDPQGKKGHLPFTYPPIQTLEKELTPRLEAIAAAYLEAPFRLEDCAIGGSTTEVVSAGLKEFERRKLLTRHFEDMATSTLLAKNYPLRESRLNHFHRETGPWKGDFIEVTPLAKESQTLFEYVFRAEYPVTIAFDYRIENAGSLENPSRVSLELKLGDFDAVSIAGLEIDTAQKNLRRFINHPSNAAGDSDLVARTEYFDTKIACVAQPESAIHHFECEYDGKALRMGGLPSPVDLRFQRAQAAFIVQASTQNTNDPRPKVWIGRVVINGTPITVPSGVDRLREDDVSTGRQR